MRLQVLLGFRRDRRNLSVLGVRDDGITPVCYHPFRVLLKGRIIVPDSFGRSVAYIRPRFALWNPVRQSASSPVRNSWPACLRPFQRNAIIRPEPPKSGAHRQSWQLPLSRLRNRDNFSDGFTPALCEKRYGHKGIATKSQRGRKLYLIIDSVQNKRLAGVQRRRKINSANGIPARLASINPRRVKPTQLPPSKDFLRRPAIASAISLRHGRAAIWTLWGACPGLAAADYRRRPPGHVVRHGVAETAEVAVLDRGSMRQRGTRGHGRENRIVIL